MRKSPKLRVLVEFVHDHAEEQRVLGKLLVALVKLLERLSQHLEGVPAVQLLEHIVFAGGYLHPLSDRAAALRDDGVHGYIAVQRQSDGSIVVNVFAEIECVGTGLATAGRESAYLRASREGVVESHEQILALYAERVGQNHELRVVRRGDADHFLPRGGGSVAVRHIVVVYVKSDYTNVGQDRGGQRQAGTVFHLPSSAYNATAGAAYEKAFAEQLAHQAGKLVVAGSVVGRHKRDDQVRPLVAKRVRYLAGALRGGIFQKSVFG